MRRHVVSGEKAGALLGRGDQTLGTAARETMAVFGNEPVHGIPQWAWNELRQHGDSPTSSQIGRDPNRRGGSGEDGFSSSIARCRFYPNDRIDVGELRVTHQHATGKHTLERGKTQVSLAVVLQNELDALGTKAAGTVIQENRSVRIHRSFEDPDNL